MRVIQSLKAWIRDGYVWAMREANLKPLPSVGTVAGLVTEGMPEADAANCQLHCVIGVLAAVMLGLPLTIQIQTDPLGNTLNQGPRSLLFDNVRLDASAVPEPTSLALIGVVVATPRWGEPQCLQSAAA